MPTILVADDNSNIQKMVSLVFKEKGINVVAVGNGEAACRKVPEVHPDVVLADVFMPVRSGYEVCEFVKQDPQFAETPVILLVGAFDPLDEKEAQRVGANGVLKKPFVPPEPLITMVSSLLKIEAPAEEPQAPAAPEESFMPQSPAESGPTARQRAIASAQAQYAGTDDETVTTFGAPVAAPKSQAEEIQEDDSEPASEWAKRRASMDYEIDVADSADMVEKLAAQGTVEEPEIQAANKHLPFGGANISEMLSESPVESASPTWPAPAPEVSTEPAAPAIPNAEAMEEFSLTRAIQERNQEELSMDAPPASARKYGEAEIEPVTPFLRVPRPTDLERVPEQPKTRFPEKQEAVAQPPFASSPQEQSTSSPFDPLGGTDTKSSFAEASLEFSKFGTSESSSTVPTEPEVIFADSEAPSAANSEAAAIQDAPSKAPVDQATVDDVVAKVISKLEPQLHQALANGVLRPLVEELLNQQREKK